MYPFTYQEDHKAEALAIFCMDHRFQKALHYYIENELKIKHYDRVAVAGAGMSLLGKKRDPDYVVLEKQIILSLELHEIKKVIVVHHTDCGAYGGSKAFKSFKQEERRHLEDMEKIKEKIKEIAPGVDVLKVFLYLSNDKKAVEPEIIF